MTKRIKPPVVSVPAITSIEEADSTLARISALRRTLDLIQTGMNEDVDLIKAKTAKEAEPYNQEIAVLEQSLMRYADYHKDSLFKGRKSVALSFGSFGFRSSSKLKLFGKMTWERVLQSLRDNGLTTCIRIKEEPDKEALKGLSPEHLKDLGCRVVQEDTFFYELAEQELSPPSTGEAA